jgi:hypothetical protein
VSTNTGGWTLRLAAPVVLPGASLRLLVDGLSLPPGSHASIDLARVEEDSDRFILGGGVSVEESAGGHVLVFPLPVDLAPGLYLVSHVTFMEPGEDPSVHRRYDHRDFGVVPFLVSADSQPEEATSGELFGKYLQVRLEREHQFNLPLNGSQDTEGATRYSVFVFVKNCLVKTPMRLGQYEVGPLRGLTVFDELSLVNEFCTRNAIKPIEEARMRELLQQGESGQPTYVVHFPTIMARSASDAGLFAEQEVEIINSVLSLARNGYGEMFAGIAIEWETRRIYQKLIMPQYRGNLLGGWLSGEDPEHIRNMINIARSDNEKQLLLSLLRDARAETRWDFAYFRYWLILETKATRTIAKGTPMLDWHGNPVATAKGRVVRITEPKQQVAELLRRCHLARNVAPPGSASGIKHMSVEELISIWYRRRGCVAHWGGCFPSDTAFCTRGVDQYELCRSALGEVAPATERPERQRDPYLSILDREAEMVIFFDPSAPKPGGGLAGGQLPGSSD